MTTETIVLVLLGVVAILSFAESVDSSNSSRVNVHIPFDFHKVPGYSHAQASFGFRHRSGSISEYLYAFHEAQTLCSAITFNHTSAALPAHEGGLKSPFILMVGDGECSPVTKARHAQQLGAAALVLAHPHCLCADTDCTTAFPDDNCIDHAPVLVDDGSGGDVSIPTFLIFRDLEKKLHDQLIANQPVLMDLKWGLHPTQLGKADNLDLFVSLWTSAHDPYLDLETYQNLRLVMEKLENKAFFRPHYALIDGSRFNCQEQNEACDHLCSNHGRYCSTHARELSGYAIVRESLRRLCIWKHYVAEAEEGKREPSRWWDYVLYHKEHCSDPHSFAAEDCLKNSEAHAGVSPSVIEQCMTDSGNVDEDTSNALLELQINRQKETSVISLPAISVDHNVLDYPSSYLLFEHVCWQYFSIEHVMIPDICLKCISCPNKIGCLQEGRCVEFKQHTPPPKEGGKKKSRRGWRRFFWSMTAVAILGGAWYYYKAREDPSFGDRNLGHYLQLGGGEG